MYFMFVLLEKAIQKIFDYYWWNLLMARYISDSESDATSLCDTQEICSQSLIIWLDRNIGEPPSQELIRLKQLSEMNWEFYSDLNEAIDRVYSCLPEKRVILISSGSLGREILGIIHSAEHLEAVFIYCLDKHRNSEWVKNYSKVLCIVNEPTQLQYELGKFLVKYYKKLGESSVVSGNYVQKDAAPMNFIKAIDILCQFTDAEDAEVGLLMKELEAKRFNSQFSKCKDSWIESVPTEKKIQKYRGTARCIEPRFQPVFFNSGSQTV